MKPAQLLLMKATDDYGDATAFPSGTEDFITKSTERLHIVSFINA